MNSSGIQHSTNAETNDASRIDQSVKAPVLIFFGSATLWLVVASLFWLLSAAQLHAPNAWWSLAGVRWLTYGRSYPIFLNSLVYGWASSACIGIGIWLVAKLSGAAIRANSILFTAATLWNIGLACGTLCLIAGISTGKELLEYPSYISFILFLGLVLVSLWVFLTLRKRRPGPLFVSQWYLLVAFLTFPWAYGTANLLLAPSASAPGVSQASIHWWYVGCLIGLWFTPIGLSLAFYLIPRNLGKPLYSYNLALLGFWTLLLLAGWTGETHVLGGPLSAWLITVSTVASVLLLIPAAAVAANLHRTFDGKFEILSSDLPLRFVAIGAMGYTFYIAEGALIATRTVGRIAEFTLIPEGHQYLALFGFVSMALFGGIYFIVPRLLNRPLLTRLVKGHFWLSIYGFCLLFADLNISGVLQGLYLQDAKIPMDAVNDIMSPFLLAQCLCVFLVVIANLSFASAIAVIFLLPIRWIERNERSELATADASVSEVTIA
jgi:cytochrome c oxidase cbb3-type subunit 1